MSTIAQKIKWNFETNGELRIKDNNGKLIYWEDSNGVWEKSEYDSQGRFIYRENSFGKIIDNLSKPSSESCQTAIDTICLLEVIDRLPHSKSRVPYTYHHDYLRQHSKVHHEMSRSDVSSSHTASDVELYAIALTQLLSEVGSDAIYHLDSRDLLICKKAKEITDGAVSRYNS